MSKGRTIGEISALSGVSVDTIRFYERKGLVATPKRNSSGYRIYSQNILSQICFIKRSRDLGFSLQEASELIPLFLKQEDSGEEIRQRFEEKIEEIELDLINLAALKGQLQQMIDTLDKTDDIPTDGLLLDHFLNSSNIR